MKKILIVTDAWRPQVNGVVTTLTNVVDDLRSQGHRVLVMSPDKCPVQFPMPMYPEIKLGIPSPWKVSHSIELFRPDHIHISTPEGPLGTIYRLKLDKMGKNYTTAYHTKFPEFVNAKLPWVKLSWMEKFMKAINRNSQGILVPAPSIFRELEQKQYQNIILWSRGINTDIFNPGERHENSRKKLVCVSRVSREKNLEKFFELETPHEKIMVGDGPQLKEYRKRFPDVTFVGMKHGEELADHYRQADVFVFPSRVDTFGVVMIESLACGTPIAAYDVTGPKDIVIPGTNGYLGEDLSDNIDRCLELNRQAVFETSKIYTWEKATKDFVDSLVKCD